MNSWSLAWRNLVRQKRRTLLMGSVVAFGFAAFALAGGFIAQSFEGLKEGTIRSIGHLQIVDRRAVTRSEESTLEFGLPNAGQARAIAAGDPEVAAVLPRIEFVGLATNGAKSVPYLGVGVDPQPEATATREIQHRRIVGVDHRPVLRTLVLEDPRFRRRVRLDVRMPIEVVR